MTSSDSDESKPLLRHDNITDDVIGQQPINASTDDYVSRRTNHHNPFNTQRNSSDEDVAAFSRTNQSYGTNQNSKYNDNNIPLQSQRNYSVTKVRILLPMITTLACIVSSSNSVITQYLLDEWSNESDHSKGHHNDSDISGGVQNTGVCDRNKSDPAVIHDDAIQAKVSLAVMKYSFANSFTALIVCLVYGALVDIVGRRVAIISSLLGFTSRTLLVIIIIKFKLSPNFFFLAFGLDGIGGSFFVFLVASFSITADISGHKDSRILGIAVLIVISSTVSASISIGIGLLIKEVGFVSASLAVFIPVAMSLAIALFFLPETMPMQRQKATLGRLWDYTARTVFLYTRDGDKRTRMSLLFSLMIFFTSIMCTINIGTIDTLYQTHEPLCWDAAQLGYYSAVRSGGGYIGALIFLCICRGINCARDEFLSMMGMLFVVGSLILEAFVTNTWQMYLVPPLIIPGMNVAAITRGVMSTLVGPEKQGVLFSSIALIEILCVISAFAVYNKIYALTVDIMPGFVYLVMAGVGFITFILYFPFFYFYDRPARSGETLVQSQNDSNDADNTSPPEEEITS